MTSSQAPAADTGTAAVVVIGAGISGLAAAWDLSERLPGEQIVLVEAAAEVGGKLRGARVAGVQVDVGAESVLARRPEALRLIDQVGLHADLVHPATTAARLLARGELYRLPARTLMGIPADPRLAAGVLTEPEVRRALAEEIGERPGRSDSDSDNDNDNDNDNVGDSDISVGEFVERRLGAAVVDRIVEPLLGGVYAGQARLTSLRAALPALVECYQQATSLTEAVRAVLPSGPPAEATATSAGTPSSPPHPPPVFAGLRGGLHRLATGTAQALRRRGVQIRTGTTARELHRDAVGWRIVTGPVPAPGEILAGRVILALPAAPAARLLSAHAPRAAGLLGAIETASMAVVTLAFDSAAAPELPGSGVLVPPGEQHRIKAATFSANKWAWVAEAGVGAGAAGGDLTLLRTSIGRHRQERELQVSDDELVRHSIADLGRILGAAVPEPVDQHVQRWGGGLPQYFVGHTERVAAIMTEVASLDGLEVAGASYQGVGIPACIASGRAAAARLVPPR